MNVTPSEVFVDRAKERDKRVSQLGATFYIAWGLLHLYAAFQVSKLVSLPTIRKRLGHKNLQTTLRYAKQTDATTDGEIRAWRRQRSARQKR